MPIYVAKGTEVYQPTPPGGGGGTDGNPPTQPDPTDPTSPVAPQGSRDTKPFWWPPLAAYPPANSVEPDKWVDGFEWPGPPWPPGWNIDDIPTWWPNMDSTGEGMWAYSETTREGSNGQGWSESIPPISYASVAAAPPWWYFQNENKMSGWHRLLCAIPQATLDSLYGGSYSDVEVAGFSRIDNNVIETNYGQNMTTGFWSNPQTGISWYTEPSSQTSSTYTIDPRALVSMQRDNTGEYRIYGPPWFDVYLHTITGATTSEIGTWWVPWLVWDADQVDWVFSSNQIAFFDWEDWHIALQGGVSLDQAFFDGWNFGEKVPYRSAGWSDLGDQSEWSVTSPTKAEIISYAKTNGWLNPDNSPVASA